MRKEGKQATPFCGGLTEETSQASNTLEEVENKREADIGFDIRFGFRVILSPRILRKGIP